MTRSEKIKLSNSTLNANVKIQGTNYDRRRKLSNEDIYNIKRSAKSKSFNAGVVAERYGVAASTIKYHVDEAYKAEVNKKRVERGFNINRVDSIYRMDLANYKRSLLRAGKNLK